MLKVVDLIPPSEKGVAKVKHFEFKKAENPLFNLRALRDDPDGFMREGTYAQLFVDRELMMSDTDLEIKTNREFVRKANGHVLIAGLGLGLILRNTLEKPDIKTITVIEKSQDVIDLITPYYPSDKLIVICADIFEWQPAKGVKFDTIYFDIWPGRSVDNLTEIKQLHAKFKYKLNRANAYSWMDSWYKSQLQKLQKRQKNRYSWY